MPVLPVLLLLLLLLPASLLLRRRTDVGGRQFRRRTVYLASCTTPRSDCASVMNSVAVALNRQPTAGCQVPRVSVGASALNGE
jgi:hypothetical protein